MHMLNTKKVLNNQWINGFELKYLNCCKGTIHQNHFCLQPHERTTDTLSKSSFFSVFRAHNLKINNKENHPNINFLFSFTSPRYDRNSELEDLANQYEHVKILSLLWVNKLCFTVWPHGPVVKQLLLEWSFCWQYVHSRTSGSRWFY